MPTRPSLSIAVLLVAGAACGVPGAPPALSVNGAVVRLETEAPFAAQPDFPARLESTLGAALAYWGGTWADLDGFGIVLTDAPRVACGGAESALGCQEGRSIRLTTMDPGAGQFSCVEQTVLVHEVGHAVIGDALHQDSRWMELEPVAEALGGRVGYGLEGRTDCTIFLSVWRHLRGVP